MAIELHLSKTDNATPWGFRLTGGANFEVPLTTIKVIEDSIAQNCGLEVGDIIVKINDDDITALTHAQAHDRIVQSGDDFRFTIARGQISEILQSLIQEEECNNELHDILEGTVPIDYPEKTIEDLIKDTENETNQKNILPQHDLNLTDEEIHSIISPEIAIKKGKAQNVEAPVPSAPSSNEVKHQNGFTDDRPKKANGITKQEVQIMQSEVIKEINNNMSEFSEPDRKWSTFLQRPQRPVPDFKQTFAMQKSTYKVVIRTKKDLEAEKEAKKAELEAALLQKENEENAAVENGQTADEEQSSEEEELEDSDFTFSDSMNITEDTISFTPSGTEPTITFTETLNSLEEKLEHVKEQLQIYNINVVPDSLQKTLAKIAAQLEKIVKVVKPAAKGVEENDEQATENEYSDDEFSDDESISFDSRISSPTPSTPSYQGTEPTLTFTSYSIMSDPPSASTPEGTEPSLTFSDNAADVAEGDRTECDVTEMHDYQEEAPAGQTQRADAKEEKTSKHDKDAMEASGPLTPLTRPIILPGGRKWGAPDDAVRAVRHPSLTDEKIDQTISSYYEVISGKTVGESNCCLVPSKMSDTNKINFLKYQPPPKNLDHLKNSEVYKMVHDTNTDASKGIFGRPAKVLSGQDYHSNERSQEEPPQMER